LPSQPGKQKVQRLDETSGRTSQHQCGAPSAAFHAEPVPWLAGSGALAHERRGEPFQMGCPAVSADTRQPLMRRGQRARLSATEQEGGAGPDRLSIGLDAARYMPLQSLPRPTACSFRTGS
jgi:hypothetical protein